MSDKWYFFYAGIFVGVFLLWLPIFMGKAIEDRAAEIAAESSWQVGGE